jgi:prepilin-type N-terminal cleavage/methylation domain-containing protein/prepilin-type processing-associated H-X9-DG protein
MAASACASERAETTPRGPEQTQTDAPATPRRGFTLVELLVVIGIIALLISILLPALNRARESGMKVQCLSNIRQVGIVFTMYINQSKGRLPPYPASIGNGPQPCDWIYWQTLPATMLTQRPLDDSPVLRLMGTPVNPAVMRCPSDRWEEHVAGANGTSTAYGPYFFSYSLNQLMTPGTPTAPKSLSISSIKRPAEKVLLVEEDERTINDGRWAGTATGGDYLSIRHDRNRIQPDDSTNWNRNVDRGGNVVFLDGHAAYTPRKDAHNQNNVDPAVP